MLFYFTFLYSSQFLRDLRRHNAYTIIEMIMPKLYPLKIVFIFLVWTAFTLYGASSALCFVSSGGDYEMEFSRVVSGGQLSSGGNYTAKGAVSQIHLPEGIGSLAGEYVNRVGFYNPPRFTYQGGLPVQLFFESGNVELFLPANSINRRVFDITINKDAVNNPVLTDSAKVINANNKMKINEGDWSRLYSGNISEMFVFDEQDYWTDSFPEKGLLAMSYEDVDNDGILDGSNPPVRVETIQSWALDEEYEMWVKMAGANFDINLKKISVPLRAPGIFALFGQLDNSVKDAHAFPVPFRPNGPNAGIGMGKTGTEADGIIFTNVPDIGNIEIYTIDGRLVKDMDIASNVFDTDKVNWDVKNDSGQKVASGVYIWRVVSGSNSKTGKLMIIR